MPLSKEALHKIRRIHLKTNFLSTELFTGEYESAFKGTGMTFEEVREYAPGDDVRLIDWNVTARTGRPHLKVFRQERERTLMLMVDTSASMRFGGKDGSKRDLAAELAALFAYAAIKKNDKVGLLMFSGEVERFIPPRKGRGHVWRLIEEILSFTPRTVRTELETAAKYLLRMVKRRAICIVISDFLTADFARPLSILRGRHDVVALHIRDRLEDDWPDLGLVPVEDAESGERQWIDTASGRFKRAFPSLAAARVDELKQSLGGKRIDLASLRVGDDYIHALMELFRRRERRR